MKAELIDVMGDDLRVVNAARVSFDKESKLIDGEEEAPHSKAWEDLTGQKIYKQVLSPKDQKLISYLAKHNHFTPFTHIQITMREKVPIFVARQRFKHTVGWTYNEVSRRYVDDAPEFYVPDAWRLKSENKKQGSSDETVDLWKFSWHRDRDNSGWDWSIGEELKETYERILQTYERMIEVGVAPEQARMVLPQSMYTEYIVTGSLYAWAHAYKLRSSPDAQKEIRDLAEQWNEIFSNIPELKHSWKALTGN